MARVCQVTGKKPMSGNNVSHAHNKTRRRFLPNLHRKRFYVPSLGHKVTLRVSQKGLKYIDRYGVEAALNMLPTDIQKEGKK